MDSNYYIIEIGNPREKRFLSLSTKLGNLIPNVQRPEYPSGQAASVNRWKKLHPNAQLHSWSHTYNAMGMVFASRRTHVAIESLPFILREDDYRKLSSLSQTEIGDVVVYALNDQPRHVGIIMKPNPVKERESLILSKWGCDGEYLHSLFDVPEHYGAPTEFWTDRR
jgi:hypothetical protein